MEAGLVVKGPSSLKLSPMPGMEGRDILQITSISTDADQQNQGHASALLKEICRRADMSRFMLVISPEPFGKRALDAKQLERWYAKHGFETIQKKPVLMAREPKVMRYDINTDEMVPTGLSSVVTERLQ